MFTVAAMKRVYSSVLNASDHGTANRSSISAEHNMGWLVSFLDRLLG
jgi:hypothetical protein